MSAKTGRRAPKALSLCVCAAAVACLQAAGTTRMVHGHTHRPGDSTLAPGFDRLVLSDWDLDDAQQRAEVLRLSAGGFERLTPRDACRRG